ncbi:MAG: MmcB family DNA repair protein [Rhodospirillaceae bacterium]|nr:MmcB family DNA repair protein [Rhodospirillaceae bacterium]
MMNTTLARRKSQAIRYTDAAAVTAGVTRGVCRWLGEMGYAALTEFKLGNGRRADIAGLAPNGSIVMVEVKSTVADFRADDKWFDYVPYCDGFSFAVPEDFPRNILPEACGILVADRHTTTVVRPAVMHRLHPARRKALTLRFAHGAGQRLMAMTDPRI